MALVPLCRLGPPSRSFAADAHGCIMVPIPMDRPNTRLRRDDPRPMAGSPPIVPCPPDRHSPKEEAASDNYLLTAKAPYKDGLSAAKPINESGRIQPPADQRLHVVAELFARPLREQHTRAHDINII